jgi:hypothetical protein
MYGDERNAADVKTIAVLAAGIYHRNDRLNHEGRTPAQCKRDAVVGVERVLEGLVDDVRNARSIARAAVAAVYR